MVLLASLIRREAGGDCFSVNVSLACTRVVLCLGLFLVLYMLVMAMKVCSLVFYGACWLFRASVVEVTGGRLDFSMVFGCQTWHA